MDFIKFKERNKEIWKERETCHENWILLERAFAMKTPVMEAEFAIDERSPLSLYDNLIPTLREHRKFKINLQDEFSIEDFMAQKATY